MDGRLTIGPPNSSFANVSALPANIYVGYNAKVVFGESISVGPGVNIIVKDNASLEVGAGTYFTSDMHVEVVNSVKIGKQCAIAWGTSIIDADHHKIHYGSYRESSKNDIVHIGDHVWIGCNCVVLKGSVLGEHSIVAAGSVVRGEFPSHCLIAGNPAKVIKRDVTWE